MTKDFEERYEWAGVSQLFSPVHNMFSVTFRDGYSNVFFTDVETGKWIEQGLGYTELAEKIGERLDELFPTEDKTTRKLEWVCEERGNHLFNFGYCHYVLNTFEVFEIYTSDRRYLCNLLLMNTNSWLVLHLNDEPDLRGFQSLVIEIPAILEKLVRM